MATTTTTTARELRPTPTDGYQSPTSELQAQTEALIKAQLPGNPPREPLLQRQLHLQFLLRNLNQGFPERYVSQDASQPWLIFWTLQGFSILGVGLDDITKKRARQTLLALQHPDGGFSGGPGQSPHLLPTYAAVCALAIVGQPGPGGAWDEIDRKKMYSFFMSLKQADGSFTVMRDGEVDVRGIYCLLVTATLLNIITPDLIRDVPQFIASCQTYEGGFGNASFPDWALGNGEDEDIQAPRPPLGEAHGGYTFCSTASWALLLPALSIPFSSSTSSPYLAAEPKINLPSLIRWTAQMQGAPIELGGFKGRTNKLVDGCYSWWVGGCAGIVEGLLVGSGEGGETKAAEDGEEEDGWDDVDDDALYNRRALQEYILYAGQFHAGGLRDKPPKPADAYHTLYCLSGLSAAQHRVVPSHSLRSQIAAAWKAEEARAREGAGYTAKPGEEEALEKLRKEIFVNALSWAEDEGSALYAGGSVNRVNATHPLFNLTATHARGIMSHFYGQTLPPPTTSGPRASSKKHPQ